MTNYTVEPIKLQLDSSELQTGVTTIENLVKAIHDATTALNELTTALTNQSVGGTVFDVLSTAISALSLACDLKGGKAVIDFFQNMGKSIANFAEGIPMLFSILAGAAGPGTEAGDRKRKPPRRRQFGKGGILKCSSFYWTAWLIT